jgi:hypothetical protein
MEDVACGLGEFCKFSRAVEVTYLTPLRIVVSRAPDRLWRHVPRVCMIFGSSVNLCGTLDHSRRLPRMLMYPSEGSGRLVYRQS